MNKKQEQYSHRLFPIQQDVLDADFAELGKYDTDNIELLKKLWLDASLDGNPSHDLLKLVTRPELQHYDQIRRTYRAGILVGTVIMRHQLRALDEDYGVVNLSHTPDQEPTPATLIQRKLSRFALSQFFDSKEPVDITEHLKDTLEADWLRRHNSFQPEVNHDAPANDWLAVGMGDTLALYGMRYAAYMHAETPAYATKPLKYEPGLHDTPDTPTA